MGDDGFLLLYSYLPGLQLGRGRLKFGRAGLSFFKLKYSRNLVGGKVFSIFLIDIRAKLRPSGAFLVSGGFGLELTNMFVCDPNSRLMPMQMRYR